MSDATTEAVLKLYDHLADALGLIRKQEERIAELESRTTAQSRALIGINTIGAGRDEEIAELRDFVHGLNDRHTSLELRARHAIKSWEGATAPVAEDGQNANRICRTCGRVGIHFRWCATSTDAPVAEVAE